MKTKTTIKSRFSLITFELIVFLFLSLSACEKFFKPEEFYLSNIKSEEELAEAVNGINDYFARIYFESYIDGFGDDYFLKVEYNLMGRPSQSIENYLSYYGPKICVKGSENGLANINEWEKNYFIIASCNNLLNQFEIKTLKKGKIKEMLGECLLYRAWCNYRLTRIYGRIPLVDNPDVDYTVNKSSYPEIYEFIENDLLAAIECLPLNNFESRIPYLTPNRGAAKALLGEVYLSWAGFPANDKTKYEYAERVTGDLIDSAAFYGYELCEDFEDLWNKKGYFNNETILCTYIDRKAGTRTYIYRGESTPIQKTNDRNGFGIDEKTAFRLWDSPNSEIEFFNNYPKGYRKDITFFTRIYVYPITNVPNLDTGYFYVDKTDCQSRAAYRKFYIDTVLLPPDRQINPQYEEYYNVLLGCPKIYHIRYAQTLLTFAEASARSGNLNEKSYECINKIRRRANKLDLNSPSPYDLIPGLSPEAFADSVVQERAWEFAGEHGHRWFDMVRLGIVEKVFESRDPNDGGPFKYTENDKYFYPLPEHDINLNPNLGE